MGFRKTGPQLPGGIPEGIPLEKQKHLDQNEFLELLKSYKKHPTGQTSPDSGKKTLET